jgi:hypothetical protein
LAAELILNLAINDSQAIKSLQYLSELAQVKMEWGINCQSGLEFFSFAGATTFILMMTCFATRLA